MTKEEEKYTTLDTEQCKWWVNTLFGIAKEKACNSHNFDDGREMQAAQDKIIKALEKEDTDTNVGKIDSDCVSRQAVDQLCYRFLSHSAHEIAFYEHFCDLPSVTPTQRWVPVSERMPEERTAVLVWCPERKNIYCACYEEKQWWIFGAYFEKITLEVTAWQPLPKPYEE